MRCDKCRDESVIFQPYSSRYLCGRHLALDIEARAKRSIRSHRWMRPGDHIAVLVSGDRKSAALLCFLQKLTADRRDIHLSAVLSGGDVAGKDGRLAAMKVAESLRIPCIEMPLPGGSGTAARDMITKIALAVSLDDIAHGVLGEFLFGNAGRLVHPPPDGPDRIPVICPFIAVPSHELDLYWEIGGTGINLQPCTPGRDTSSQETGALLKDYCRRHPATKYALLHLAEQLSGGNAVATAAAGVSGSCAGDDNVSPQQKRPNS
jgi:tRNA(Ile)-lysidine synthase TilS/MesJ